ASILQHLIALQDLAMVFLTGVLATAVLGGLGPSIVAVVVSLFLYDFFFIPPVYTFTITNPQDVLSLLVFLIVAVLTSNLATRIRTQAESARQREARTAALYAFSRQVAAAAGMDDLGPIVARHVAEEFQCQAVVLLPGSGGLVARAGHPPGTELPETDLAAATWVWQHNQAAGRGSDTLPGGAWLLEPLATARGVVGVLALRAEAPGAALPFGQRQLLEALARQAAIAIERTQVDAVLQEKAKTEAVMEAIEDGLIVLDPAGAVVHVNAVACTIPAVHRAPPVGPQSPPRSARRHALTRAAHAHHVARHGRGAAGAEQPRRRAAASARHGARGRRAAPGPRAAPARPRALGRHDHHLGPPPRRPGGGDRPRRAHLRGPSTREARRAGDQRAAGRSRPPG